MTTTQVTVHVGVKRVGNVDLPVIAIMFDEVIQGMAEILSFAPTKVQLAADDANMTVDLVVDGNTAVTISKENGDLLAFTRKVNELGTLVVLLVTLSQDKLHILNRMLIAEAALGRVISDTGPRKIPLGASSMLGASVAATSIKSIDDFARVMDASGRGGYANRFDPSIVN